jgi:hypothetical protein
MGRPPANAKLGANQLIELETLLSTLLTLPPTVRIEAIAATAISEAISVYSIAVAPCWFFINLRKMDSISISKASNWQCDPDCPGKPPNLVAECKRKALQLA